MIVHNIPSFINAQEAMLAKSLLDEDYDKFGPIIVSDEFYSDYASNGICQDRKIIGEGLYAIPSSQDINSDIKTYMYNRYQFLYHKVIEFLEHIYQLSVVFKEDLTIPGFHYFKKSYPWETPWHLDNSLNGRKGYEDINPHSIHSFALSIKMPYRGHIEFKQTDDYQFETLEDSDTQKFYYEERSFVTWPGMQMHRIGNNFFDEIDPRITFQGHFHLGKDEIILFF